MDLTSFDQKNKDRYKSSRILYIIQAAVEYFIATLAGGAYLAKATEAVGMPDDVTAILTALVSLGVGFQLVALFIPRKRTVKAWVTPCMLLYQLLFTFIYVVPMFNVTSGAKILIMFTVLLVGHIIQNIVYSPKINWLMGLVDEHKRGSFTAVKEIVSLTSGMLYTFVIGLVMDHFEAKGDINGAFVACGIILFSLSVIHTLILIFTREKPIILDNTDARSVKSQIKEVITDKNLWKVLPVSIIWAVATYSATPFYGTYQNKELGFTMTFVSVLAAISSLVRALISAPLGRFADKHSFTKMLNICFTVAAAAFFINIFTVPENGKIFYSAYSVLYAVSMAGINSSAINLIYDVTPRSRRTGALAIRGALAGFIGFFSTLTVRPLVKHIQENGNTLFGMNVYAQQAVSLIAFVFVVAVIVYLNTALKKIKKAEN
jgi:hypothetical protein